MPKLSDFHFSTCQKDDICQLINFAKKMKSSGYVSFLPQDEQTFLNKYTREDNPDILNLFLLKDGEDNIIGCTGYVPFKGLFASKALEGFIADDAFIDPDFRKPYPGLAPLFARSYEQLIRRDKLLALACPVDIDTANRFKKVQWAGFTWLYKFNHMTIANISPELDSSIKVEKINIFPDDMGVFFQKISRQHEFILNASLDMLNWNYFKKPFSDNIVLSAKKDGQIIGYIVLKQKDCDIHIVDVTVDLEHPQAVLFLIYEAFVYCSQRSVSITFCYLSHQRYIDIFKRSGFECCLELECLFFKVGMVLYSSIDQETFHSSDKSAYHFNGFTSHVN